MRYSLFRFLTILFMMVGRMVAKRSLINIFWNTTSPMFRIDNTDNVIDINQGNLPWEFDQANIICPVYSKDTREEDTEKYIIYSVTREEYENCRINTQNPKVVAVCNKPYQLLYVTITFRSFTPTPGGLEFEPGQDYYWISTSSKRDLYRRIGGRCSTHNMRATFKVADTEHDNRPPQDRPRQHQGFSSTVNVPRSLDANSRRADVLLAEGKRPRPIYHEVEGSNSIDVQLDGRRRRMPDAELIKQEASVMRPGAAAAASSSSSLSLASLLVSILLAVCVLRQHLRTLLLPT